MPFNENGTFERVHNWTQDKSNNIPITASRMDAEDDGFATGLSQTFLRDGSIALTGDLKAGNNKLTGLKAGTESTDAATIGQLNTVQGNAVLLTGDQTVAGTKTFTSSPVAPNPSADDSSTKVATTKWVNTTGNNVVHITGAETITGNKTFSNGYKSTHGLLYNDNITKGTAPSSNSQYINMYMVGDSRNSGDSNALGLFRTYVTTSNIVYSTMQAFKNVASSGAASILRTYYHTAQNKFGVELQALNTDTDTNESMTAITNATDSPRIPTMGWVNNPATSTNVVHRSGDETIAGTKTFNYSNTIIKDYSDLGNYISNNLILYGYNDKPNTIQNSFATSGILLQANGDIKEENCVAALKMWNLKSGTAAQLRAYEPVANSTTYARLGIYYPQSGSPYTYAPTPSLGSSDSGYSNQIVTVGYLNGSNSSVVHRSGAESIAGNKTFSGATTFTGNVNITGNASVHITRTVSGLDYSGFLVQNTSLTKGTAPSTSCGGQWLFQAKDGINEANRIGGVYSRVRASSETTNPGAYETVIAAYKPEASSTTNADIRIIYPTSGSPYAKAPASSVDGSIVTTTAISKQTKGYVKLGNGLIIQWGNSDGNATVNLPIEFSNTNYHVVATNAETITGGFINEFYITDKQTQSFKLSKYSNNNAGHWIAIGY